MIAAAGAFVGMAIKGQLGANGNIPSYQDFCAWPPIFRRPCAASSWRGLGAAMDQRP
jgi:hypothetical protein